MIKRKIIIRKNGYCDNTDCKPPLRIKSLYLTILHEDFNHDACWWCADCIKRDADMVRWSELDELRGK